MASEPGDQPGQKMESGPPVEPGAVVEARDGRLGTVEQVAVRPETGELAYLVVRRGWTDQRLMVPAAAIEALPDPREVRLRLTREEAHAQAAAVPSEMVTARQEGSELHLPIVEERLVPATRPVDLGELRLHKRGGEAQEHVRQPVTRDDVEVYRVSVNRPIEAPVAQRVENDWLIIPIMKEVLVVRKQLVLEAEVRIRRRKVTEEQEVAATVRRERIEIEDAAVPSVHGLETAPSQGATPAEPRPPA